MVVQTKYDYSWIILMNKIKTHGKPMEATETSSSKTNTGR